MGLEESFWLAVHLRRYGLLQTLAGQVCDKDRRQAFRVFCFLQDWEGMKCMIEAGVTVERKDLTKAINDRKWVSVKFILSVAPHLARS